MITKITYFLLISFSLSFKFFEGDKNSDEITINNTIKAIYQKLRNEQSHTDISFRFFPPRPASIKGLYNSYIHLNYMDSENSWLTSKIRQFGCLDNNMFVTNFVVYTLLEASNYGIQYDENELNEALEAILQFNDKNFHNTPLYTFWKQKEENGIWSQYPETMVGIMKKLPRLPNSWILKLYEWGFTKTAFFFATFQGSWDAFNNAYRIPADSDDTTTALTVTALLYKLNITEKHQNWIKNNTNYEELFGILKHYSYRPFYNYSSPKAASEHSDMIETRTYYWIHEYLNLKLEEFKSKNKVPNLIFINTWVFDYSAQKNFFPNISMPLNANNIDLNVAVNSILGITDLLLYHNDTDYIIKIYDEEMLQMITDSIDLFNWVINSNIINIRPDLCLLYYPSILDFYWLMSRTYFALKNRKQNLSSISFRKGRFDDLIEYWVSQLESALRVNGTDQILEKVQTEGDMYYFYEFLGNYANFSRNEDSLFATGLGLNALINIWTIENKTSIQYDINTPEKVKKTIDGLVRYITRYITKSSSSKECAFFSGSVHNYNVISYYYPGNFYKYLNGSEVLNITNPSSVDVTLTCAVKGVIERNTFANLSNGTYFGKNVTKTFSNLNENPFPYWSSPAITYSVNLLGLIKYQNIINK